MDSMENELFHLRAERGVLIDFIRQLAKDTTDDYALLALAYINGLESMREWDSAKRDADEQTWDEIRAAVAGNAGRVGEGL